MFGKFMNNYYYGKSGKGDYRRDDLPRSRSQQFREMLRIRFSALFRLNIMCALAFLPLMYVLMVMVNNLFTHLLSLNDALSDPALGQSAAQLRQDSPLQVYSILFSGFVLLVPAVLITGPVQAGLAFVTRNWARDEHAFIWSDFKDAVKENWKQSLLASLITGLLPLLLLVSWQFYGSLARGGSIFFVVPQMLSFIIGLVWALALVYLYPMMVTYRMGFGTLVRNSLLLSLGRLPQTAGARLAMLVPALAAALVAYLTPYAMYALMALAGYYFFIGNALARFAYAAVSNAAFDRYLNPRIPGAPVNRGLAPAEEEEGEEEA